MLVANYVCPRSHHKWPKCQIVTAMSLAHACHGSHPWTNQLKWYSTIMYQVFYHDLLITKLHYIDYKIKLMACIVQKIYFMATRKSNYLNLTPVLGPTLQYYSISEC